MAAPATLFDKIWSSHAIQVRLDGATLLHIDRHLVHDGSGNAFGMLKFARQKYGSTKSSRLPGGASSTGMRRPSDQFFSQY